MENENMEVVTNEVLDVVVDEANKGSKLKTVGKIGGIILGAAALTKFVLIPVGKRVKRGIKNLKAKRAAQKAPATEIDPDDIHIDDVPDVE